MHQKIKHRFAKLLPVVVDIETSGVDWAKHGILEIAAISLDCANNLWHLKDTYHQQVNPFEKAELDPTAMRINQIDLKSRVRESAIDESTMLETLKVFVSERIQAHDCKKAILVGHNAHFDLNFLNEAAKRCGIELPFHSFSTLDTVSLGAFFFKETVLAKALFKSRIGWQSKYAHSALYDTRKTAQLFCQLLNEWDEKIHSS